MLANLSNSFFGTENNTKYAKISIMLENLQKRQLIAKNTFLISYIEGQNAESFKPSIRITVII